MIKWRPRHPWRWSLLFALAMMLAYIWIWHSPDLIEVKRWVSEASHHPGVIIGVILFMVVTMMLGLPGTLGLWLTAPFYPPLVATLMLTVGSTLGAYGAYQVAAKAGARWQPGGLTLRVMTSLEQRSDLFSQCALRIMPGFPHSVINFAAGLRRIPLRPFIAATVLGLAVKWAIYSSAIHNALEAIEEDDPLQWDVLWPLAALTLLLLGGGWCKRRWEAARERG